MNLKIHMMKPGYPALQERDVTISLKFLEDHQEIRRLKEQGFYVVKVDVE